MSDFHERIHPPTKRRRQEARDAGNIARSRDLQLGLFLLWLTVVVHWSAERLPHVMRKYLRTSIEQVDATTNERRWLLSDSQAYLGESLGYFLKELWPFWMLPLAAIVAMLVQVGPLFRPQLAAPDFGRLSPSRGWSRVVSLEVLSRLLGGTVKLTILSAIAWNWVRWSYESQLAESLPEAWSQGANQAASFLLALSLGLIAWGAIDYLLQRWKLERSLRMTPAEFREEQRRNERSRPVHRSLGNLPRSNSGRELKTTEPSGLEGVGRD